MNAKDPSGKHGQMRGQPSRTEPHIWMRVERTSRLASFLSSAAIITAIASLFLFLRATYGLTTRAGTEYPPLPWLKDFLPWGLVLTGLLAVIRLGLKSWFTIEPSERAIYHHFTFFGWSGVRLLAQSEDLHCLAVEGRLGGARGTQGWEYRVTAVHKRAHAISLTDWHPILSHVNERGTVLADLLDLEVLTNTGERELVIHQRAHPIRIQLRFIPWWKTQAGRTLIWLVAIVLCAVLLNRLVVWSL